MNLGNDELSRPVTDDAVRTARTLQAKLQLLASIPSPLQSHLSDCARISATSDDTRTILDKQVTDLRSSLVPILLPEIHDALREDYLLTKDLSSEMLDAIMDSRAVRAEIEEVATNALDLDDLKDDLKHDIKSDIESELEDKVNDLISGFDFGDMLDDHTRELDEKIVKRLADEISDDPKHPLVDAVLNALVLRIGRA